MAAPGAAPRDLPRLLGMLDATAIVVGIVMGSGIFVLPNVIARNVPSYAGIWTAILVISGSAAAAQPEGPELPRIAAAFSELSAGPQFAHLRRDETRLHVIYQRALYNLLILRTSKKRSEPKKSRVSNISPDSAEPTEPNQPEEPKVA